MTENMVERVARILKDELQRQINGGCRERGVIEADVVARAAIQAMRDCTPEMEAAAIEAGTEYYRGDPIGWKEIPVMWQAMIDEALK